MELWQKELLQLIVGASFTALMILLGWAGGRRGKDRAVDKKERDLLKAWRQDIAERANDHLNQVNGLRRQISDRHWDTERLDRLDVYLRSMDKFDEDTHPGKSMWAFFAPEGVHGDTRKIIDAAIGLDLGVGLVIQVDPDVPPRGSLTFDHLREANVKRLPVFRNSKGKIAHSQPDGSDWSISDWYEAVVGEVGELGNWHKKYRRGDITWEEYLVHAGKEMADVVTYLDILALQHKLSLGEVTALKFNEVSKRVGCEIYLYHNRD